MWKRIQTLYLGIATALIVAMFFMNFATFVGKGGAEVSIRYYEMTSYLIMLIMLLTAQVCALFTFKVPILQARVSMLSALLMVGFQIWLAIDFFGADDSMTFSVSMVFPIAATILDAMASRSALVDGMTIKAFKSLKARKGGKRSK